MDHVDVGNTKLEEIIGLPKEWKEGSVKGQMKYLIKLVPENISLSEEIDFLMMGLLKAFGRVKGQTNLSSEDKWNPADIWMVKESEIDAIKKHLDGRTLLIV